MTRNDLFKAWASKSKELDVLESLVRDHQSVDFARLASLAAEVNALRSAALDALDEEMRLRGLREGPAAESRRPSPE